MAQRWSPTSHVDYVFRWEAWSHADTSRKVSWVLLVPDLQRSVLKKKWTWQVQQLDRGLSDRGQSRPECGISDGGTRKPPMNFPFGEITNGSHRGREHHQCNFLRKWRCRFTSTNVPRFTLRLETPLSPSSPFPAPCQKYVRYAHDTTHTLLDGSHGDVNLCTVVIFRTLGAVFIWWYFAHLHTKQGVMLHTMRG